MLPDEDDWFEWMRLIEEPVQHERPELRDGRKVFGAGMRPGMEAEEEAALRHALSAMVEG